MRYGLSYCGNTGSVFVNDPTRIWVPEGTPLRCPQAVHRSRTPRPPETKSLIKRTTEILFSQSGFGQHSKQDKRGVGSPAQSDLALQTWRIFVWSPVLFCVVWLLKLWFHLCCMLVALNTLCYLYLRHHITLLRPPYQLSSSLK